MDAGRGSGGRAIATQSSDARTDPTAGGPAFSPAYAEASQVDLSGVPEIRAILRIRPFRRLFLVLGVRALGDWLGLLAVSLFAFKQFENPKAQGVAFGSVIAVRLLPALVLGPLAGVLADRFDRRHTMVVCDLLRFPLFLSIPVAGVVTHGGAEAVLWAAIATFALEAISMIWAPAKDAAVPNLVPRARLEKANQLSLVATYGITPVLAALILGLFTGPLTGKFIHEPTDSWVAPINLVLYFNALTFLLTAVVVWFGIQEISRHGSNGQRNGAPAGPGSGERPVSMLRQFVEGWQYLSGTLLVRGLVYGMLGAFAGAGVVVGSAKFYAHSVGGGDAAFALLFALLFVGFGVGTAFGPRIVGGLSRRRWFAMSIVLASGGVLYLAVAPHLAFAGLGSFVVGTAAGMALLSGLTLLGGEVDDEMRGRVFAVIQTATRFVLMLAISLTATIEGLGSSRHVELGGFVEFDVSTTRILLLLAGLVGVASGVSAFRSMDDRPGIGVLGDLWASIRGRPLAIPEPVGGGVFVVFEGGEGAGKTTQLRLLADALAGSGRDVVRTREPGASPLGARIRDLVLDRGAGWLSPRAEALLYAADRADHVSSVVRPALDRGAVVLSDRYVDSSVAYQGAGRTLPPGDVAWLSQWATSGLRPDLVVLLDIDPRVGLARVDRRGAADRLESESLAFHERVRYAFLDLAAAEPRRYLVLDATADPDVLAGRIRARVADLVPTIMEFPSNTPSDRDEKSMIVASPREGG